MSKKLLATLPKPEEGFYVAGNRPFPIDRLESYEEDVVQTETVEEVREEVVLDRWGKAVLDRSGKKKTQEITEEVVRAKTDKAGNPITKRVTKTRKRRFNLPMGARIPEAFEIRPRKLRLMAQRGKIVFVRHEAGGEFVADVLKTLSREHLHRLAVTEFGPEKCKELGLHPVKTKKADLIRALVSERADVPEVEPEPVKEQEMNAEERAILEAGRAEEAEREAERKRAEDKEEAEAMETEEGGAETEDTNTARAQLEAMDERHLRGVAEQHGIDHAGMSTGEIIDAVLVATGYEDPDK